MNMINCILLILLLLVSTVLLKCINFPLVIHFINFVQLFHLQVLLFIILPVFFEIFFHTQYLITTLATILFFFFFFSQIKSANLSIKFLISYDVTSLFTNILPHKTIDIAIDLIFNHNLKLNITKKELKKLLLFATSRTHFIFNSKFYNQIDGVTMGSALAPALTNIFTSFYKSKWLNDDNLNRPKLYLRYVDDILAAFDKIY